MALPNLENRTIFDAYKDFATTGNALNQQQLQNKLLELENQYYVPKTQADIASKMTYSNLMGPQFLAKLMGNEDVLANMSPEQRNAIMGLVYRAGTGQGAGNAILNGMGSSNSPTQSTSPNPPSPSPLAQRVNDVSNAFGFTPQPNQEQPRNGLLQSPDLSSQDKSSISTMTPGSSYTVQGNAPANVPNFSNENYPAPSPNSNDTFFENTARAKGIKEEGKEAGKIRAQDIKDLSDIVFANRTKEATFDNVAKIISSPEFEKMRTTPILGHKELDYYARYGTPEQQNMVGQLIALTGNIVRDASQDFKGAFRKGEQQLIQNMKVNPSDTVEAARGKIEQLSYINKMIAERARLTAQYMQKDHLNKIDAEERADREVNGDQIRETIYNQLHPRPTEEDIKFMSEKYNVPRDEIILRLKAKGKL